MSAELAGSLYALLSFEPSSFVHGLLWQPFTYSFVHVGIVGTLFELLVAVVSVRISGAVAQFGVDQRALCRVGAGNGSGGDGDLRMQRRAWAIVLPQVALYGCFGGIFGLLAAIGALYGDTEFLLFFTIGIKARYMVAIYALISIAMLFGEQRMYAFAQLGGALAGWLYVRMAPRRGISFLLSERWYGLRNGYYRWKRRRAARKFEVYMSRRGARCGSTATGGSWTIRTTRSGGTEARRRPRGLIDSGSVRRDKIISEMTQKIAFSVSGPGFAGGWHGPRAGRAISCCCPDVCRGR